MLPDWLMEPAAVPPATTANSLNGWRVPAMDKDVERYYRNWRDEQDGAALYAGLAGAETDPVRQDLFHQLSQAELSHAAHWLSLIHI